MFSRLKVYFKEMYPLLSRLLMGIILFFEISFLTILTNKITPSDIKLGVEEFVGSFTIFTFLMFLRIADDFKDFELDSRLFPERALPSGRVYKGDLKVVIILIALSTTMLNFIFMNNFIFYILLVFYGVLMSVWFFHKSEIQKNLPLALITHNPVQIIMNMYILTFACIKYNINFIGVNNLAIIFTLYFPGLVWEISRKVRAPEDENEYVTYSKLFGYKKACNFILIVMFFDVFTTSFLLYQLYKWSVITVVISYLGLFIAVEIFKKTRRNLNL